MLRASDVPASQRRAGVLALLAIALLLVLPVEGSGANQDAHFALVRSLVDYGTANARFGNDRLPVRNSLLFARAVDAAWLRRICAPLARAARSQPAFLSCRSRVSGWSRRLDGVSQRPARRCSWSLCRVPRRLGTARHGLRRGSGNRRFAGRVIRLAGLRFAGVPPVRTQRREQGRDLRSGWSECQVMGPDFRVAGRASDVDARNSCRRSRNDPALPPRRPDRSTAYRDHLSRLRTLCHRVLVTSRWCGPRGALT